ncbi:ATP-binding protein [Luteibacter sp. CQ10]|uniref:GAF domain-containing sensor histidine kinase n=1 Tax=Luteibacter sp. CQ10 TaxID=2805821 RepID=UPI0034A14E0B
MNWRTPTEKAASAPPIVEASVESSVKAIQSLSIVPSILETVCRLTGMRFSAIARVTDDRWTACAVLDHLDFGLKPGGDLVLNSTICDEIRNHLQPVIFRHASRHPVFSTHHTPRIYGLESYVSVPILTEGGRFFGTLCAIDSEPRDFDEGTIVDTLTLFASLIAANLSLELRVLDAESALRSEVDTGVLREQFLAVVGHDLRSPLQGARLIADELQPLQDTERGRRLVGHLSRCVTRMSGLIDDILDFARGRLGSGVPLALAERGDLDDVVAAAADEVRQGQPHCAIHVAAAVDGPVRFDGKRMRQLLANLLNNAVAHGDPSTPVHVAATRTAAGVDIAVTNRGKPIPADILPRLFEPFVRQESSSPAPGLGLGLYIAAEIARGHGGTLSATSCQEHGTVFTLSLPTAGPDGAFKP